METIEVKKADNKTVLKVLLILTGGLMVLGIFLIITVSNQREEMNKKDAQYNSVLQKMSTTNGVLDKQIKRADSMNLILKRIHNYMPFASTLQYQDSICNKLPHQTGDVVLMKPDSSRWVIIATSIKGGKWQHTVSYILRDSIGKQMEVEPETIY
jgi:hypothetical protein